MADRRAWVRSSILGVVEFRRIIVPPPLPTRFTKKDAVLCGGTEDIALWEVGDLFPFARPVPCHGKLNLWEPDANVRRHVAAGLKSIRLPNLPWLDKIERL